MQKQKTAVAEEKKKVEQDAQGGEVAASEVPRRDSSVPREGIAAPAGDKEKAPREALTRM